MGKKRTPRAYTLKDLQAIVAQLGGRLHLEIVPVEFVDPPKGPPDAHEPVRNPPLRRRGR